MQKKQKKNHCIWVPHPKLTNSRPTALATLSVSCKTTAALDRANSFSHVLLPFKAPTVKEHLTIDSQPCPNAWLFRETFDFAQIHQNVSCIILSTACADGIGQ